ncbi:MAG: T9SS type A sorting domain-containing protein [Flavobacteriales bacterium]
MDKDASSSIHKIVVLDFSEENNILVFPNPANGYIQLAFSAMEIGEVFIEVYDVTGKLIYLHLLATTKGNNNFYIDLGDFSQGYYSARVVAKGKLYNTTSFYRN